MWPFWITKSHAITVHFLGFISQEEPDWTFDCWVSNWNVWADWRQMKPPFSGFSPEPIQLGKLLKSLLISWSKKLTECVVIKIIQGSSATMWRHLRLPRGKITGRKAVRNYNYVNDKLSNVTEEVWRWGETGGVPLKLVSIVTPQEHWGRVKLRCRLLSPPWGDLRIKKKNIEECQSDRGRPRYGDLQRKQHGGSNPHEQGAQFTRCRVHLSNHLSLCQEEEDCCSGHTATSASSCQHHLCREWAWPSSSAHVSPRTSPGQITPRETGNPSRDPASQAELLQPRD